MKMKYAAIVMAIALMYILSDSIIGLAMSIDYMREEEKAAEKYVQMTATAYCIDGTTATGTHTRRGIAAGKREWFGKKVAVYLDDGEGNPGAFWGYYTIEDTGGEPIRNGKVIDIWMPDYDECMKFGRKKVHVCLVDNGED